MSSGNDLIERLSIEYYESARDVAMTLQVPREEFNEWVEAHVLMRLSLMGAVKQVHGAAPPVSAAPVVPVPVAPVPTAVRRERRRQAALRTPLVDYPASGVLSGDEPEEDGAPMPKEWA
jgi:hypothetical protein